jgi:hypothetical protein
MVARQSRPDILFDSCCLSSAVKRATVQCLVDVNKVIRKVKSEKLTLKFQHLGSEDKLHLLVYSDASLGNLYDGGTQGGHIILLVGQDGLFSPLYWQSRRIRRIVRSTLAGETMALADGIDSAVFIATLFMELMKGCATPELLPITCVVDNMSPVEAMKSVKVVADKRLRLDISGIKELLGKQIQSIHWSESKGQLADCLTKKGASSLALLRAISDGRCDF